MKIKILLLTCIILATPLDLLKAQKITVLDKSTNQPVESVIITGTSSSPSVITNAKGIADLAKHGRSDTIKFYHITYQLQFLA